MSKITLFYIWIGVLAAISNGEIWSSNTLGMWHMWENPKSCPYIKDNIPGSTVTACVEKQHNTTIAIRAKNGTILHEYAPKECAIRRDFCITIVTEENGFRMFLNGIYYNYYEKNIATASDIYVNTGGTMRVTFAYLEPLWATYSTRRFVFNYEVNGVEVPKQFNTNQGIKVGDYIVIESQFRENTTTMHIKLEATDRVPLIFKLRLKEEPRYTMRSIFKGKEVFIESFTGQVIYMDTDRYRIAIALVCEHHGWRVYLNGYDFLFFYHRYEYSIIKTIKLYGDTENEGGWKLMKIIHGYTT